MASLVKKPNSPYWYAAFRLPQATADGKRVWRQIRESTKQTDKGKARIAAEQLQRAATKTATGGTESTERMIGVLRDAERDAARGRLTHDAAREYLRKMTEIASGERLNMYSARSWFAEWLKNTATTAKPATMARYRHSVDSFLKHLGQTSEMPLDYIRRDHLLDFRLKLEAGGRAKKTCNHYVKDVCSALRDAVRNKVIAHSPGESLKHIPIPKTEKPVRKVFTTEQIAKLIKAAPSDEWRGVILLGAFGGLRIENAAHFASASVDMKQNVLRFTPAKTTEELTLPMHSELVQYFKKHKPTGEHCFPSLAPLNVNGCNGLSARFVKIMKIAGIERTADRERVEGMAGHRRYDLSFHCLRHTFNTAMATGGIEQEVRMKITGHSDEKSNDIYTHHQIETLRAAVESVPGLSGGKPKGKKP